MYERIKWHNLTPTGTALANNLVWAWDGLIKALGGVPKRHHDRMTMEMFDLRDRLHWLKLDYDDLYAHWKKGTSRPKIVNMRR